MKAYVLNGVGDISLDDVSYSKITEDSVLVKVKAAGICGSDIPRIYSTGAHVHPIVPGHEFSGEIVDAKEAELIGKRVGIFPLIPCMKCECCKKKQYEMCRSYSYLGSRCDGGFAEYVLVPKWNIIELPDSVSYKAAAMLEPIAVSVHAVRRALLAKEYDVKRDIAVVSGMGTIGLITAYILKNEGFEKVIALGNKEVQRKQAEKIGIIEGDFINVFEDEVPNDFLGRSTFTFECVGNNESLSMAISLAAPDGVVMLVGNPHSDIFLEKNNYWKILRNELTVLGTWNSSFTKEEEDDWHYALKLISDGKLEPEKLISHEFCLEELEKGFEIMRDKKEPYIKIMGVF